jgi:hypothetical protein
VSTSSYFPLWDAIVARKPVFDSLMKATVVVLEKLDLSTEIAA